MRPEAAGIYSHNQLTNLRNYCWPFWYANLNGPFQELWKCVREDNVALFNSYPNSNKDNVNPNPSIDPQYTYHQQCREGSAGHPSYTSGHATIIGAASVILKILFDGTTPLCEVPGLIAPDDSQLNSLIFPCNHIVPGDLAQVKKGKAYYVEANIDGTLLHVREITNKFWTINDEINKMAFNIAIGRQWLGVHYRSDSVEGVTVGQNNAIRMGQDFLASLYENKLSKECNYKPPQVKIVKLNGKIAIIESTPCLICQDCGGLYV